MGLEGGYRGRPTTLVTRNICLSTLDAKILTKLDAKKRAPDVQRHGFFAHDADAIFFSRHSTPKNNRLTTLVTPQKWQTTLDAKPIPPPFPINRTYEGRAKERERGRGGLRNCDFLVWFLLLFFLFDCVFVDAGTGRKRRCSGSWRQK